VQTPLLSRQTTFGLFYLAVFLQAGAYGLTFMLPRLFDTFGANEKIVGVMLFMTAVSTTISVYFAGHLTDRFGRIRMLGIGCISIALALVLYGAANAIGATVMAASILLGFGWGLTYALAPIVLTTLLPQDQRVRGLAFLSVAVMAGFGLSPVMAAALENTGFAPSVVFYVTACLCAAAAMLFFALIHPLNNHAIKVPLPHPARLSLATMSRIIASPARLPVIMVCIGASVFAGVTNFQTVFADDRGLNYSHYFLIYTLTVVFLRLVLAHFKGGRSPYLTIAMLQYVMAASVILAFFVGENTYIYWLVAFLFGVGYGVSYPVLVAMAAREAEVDLMAQTLQLFALSYFVGIFVFPLLAGWMIVELGMSALLVLVALLALLEATMALLRSKTD
jgi:MFS family permease